MPCQHVVCMKKPEFAVATISLVRNSKEEQVLCRALEALSALQIPVFLTDGGSADSFLSFVNSLPQVRVFSAKGLWSQAKKSLKEAGRSGVEYILYTEPDKESFFREHLLRFLAEVKTTEQTGVVLAARSATAFASFPSFQQMTENTINQCCREVIGLDIDYCYGPFVFRSRLVAALDFLPENCGWGWRPALFATAHRQGLLVDSWSGDFFCPPAQREDDETERRYRMKQLTQNIEGLLLAATREP